MTATPRTVRPVALPSPHFVGARSRLRRVAGVNARPFGAISLVLAATGILGLTSIGYLTQPAGATKAALSIPFLQQQFVNAQNQRALLESQIQQLQSYGVIMQAAKKYGMVMPSNPETIPHVTIPGPVITRVVVLRAAPVHAVTRLRLSTTNVAVASWWQDMWTALYNVMH